MYNRTARSSCARIAEICAVCRWYCYIIYHRRGVESTLDDSTNFEVRLACRAVEFPLVRKACIRRLRAAVSYRRITPDADLNCKIANEYLVAYLLAALSVADAGIRVE